MPATPLDPEEELLEELLELEELLAVPDEPEELDDEDEELLSPDEEDELLESEPEEVVSPPPPHAAKLSAKRHELARVTGRCQPVNVLIEDIFTYLF